MKASSTERVVFIWAVRDAGKLILLTDGWRALDVGPQVIYPGFHRCSQRPCLPRRHGWRSSLAST